jgi:small subunit ribosomal protein S13
MFILDTKIQEDKILIISLSLIYGVGFNLSSNLCKKLGFSKNLKLQQLSKNQLQNLTSALLNSASTSKVSNDLKKYQSFRFQKLLAIKCYRGIRRIKGLPIRGQRTHTNCRTAKKYRNINQNDFSSFRTV